MAEIDNELSQIKQYLKHHRIATYATIAFLAVFTFVSITSFQSLTQNTSTSSQAAASCPAQVLKFSDRNCTGGQAKGAYVRCNQGSRLKLIECPRSGNILQCCDINSAEFQNNINTFCGCVNPTAIPTPTSAPAPTLAPNCGSTCSPSTDSGCVGGASCFEVACPPCPRGQQCPDVIRKCGKCGGAVCEPTPTLVVGGNCGSLCSTDSQCMSDLRCRTQFYEPTGAGRCGGLRCEPTPTIIRRSSCTSFACENDGDCQLSNPTSTCQTTPDGRFCCDGQPSSVSSGNPVTGNATVSDQVGGTGASSTGQRQQ